jgi:ATP-dependent helicase/DNAse subunit B
MKVTDKGFGTYSKVIDDDTLFEMVQFTKNMIDQKTDEILSADFRIDPKVYGDKNVSCRYCSFRDLCYKSEEDTIYYDKVDDLSFLGGEE